MMYFILKIVHVVSASLWVGLIFLTGVLGYYYRKQDQVDPQVALQSLVKLEIRLGLICFLIQPLTGFSIIAIKQYNPMDVWVIGTILGYCLLGCLWLVLIFQQQRLLLLLAESEVSRNGDTPSFPRMHLVLLLSLFLVVLAMYYFMANRPL